MDSGAYVKAFGNVALAPPGIETTTSTTPAARAGVRAVIVLALTTVTPVAAVPPKVTVAPEAKAVPVKVTAVAPTGLPVFGVTAVTASETGAGPAGFPPSPPHPTVLRRSSAPMHDAIAAE